MNTTILRSRRPRTGFTLVELLVVIVIIGILAAIVTAAVIGVRITARQAVIRTEITQLESALERYKQEFGEYPPDCAGLDNTATIPGSSPAITYQDAARQRIISHLRTRFPRFTLTGDLATNWTTFKNTVSDASTGIPSFNVDDLDPRSALVFWLGGLPSPSDPTTLTGFCADPANPFQSTTASSSRIAGLMTFPADRLTVSSGSVTVYHPSRLTAPYVYLKAFTTGSGSNTAYYEQGIASEGGLPRPYLDSSRTNLTTPEYVYVNPATFQIICAGLDNGYGDTNAVGPAGSQSHGALFPSGSNFVDDASGATQFDNITNFTTTTIQAAMSRP